VLLLLLHGIGRHAAKGWRLEPTFQRLLLCRLLLLLPLSATWVKSSISRWCYGLPGMPMLVVGVTWHAGICCCCMTIVIPCRRCIVSWHCHCGRVLVAACRSQHCTWLLLPLLV
jgi:hypothetical protein